ncbi:hypothetical protein AK812_SmicGene23790 [Symbiodinium microadriaticum]|uniref:Uncharacterized protein n=1 Tax=Symbiodinium microadriaticum TaxID=2951 RepID=A0A1Q9DGB5_SYMMI|nr:hypothetical protein AK812_SmicGene23790 [Symbiodinium microadriaticum]
MARLRNKDRGLASFAVCFTMPQIANSKLQAWSDRCALIDCSADMEKTDRDGATPLYSAVLESENPREGAFLCCDLSVLPRTAD